MADIKLTADNSDVLAKLDQIQAKVKEAGDKFTSAFDKMNIAATALVLHYWRPLTAQWSLPIILLI
jgi:hypothetical protein